MAHNNDAYLQHLSHHLAWYIYHHYTSKGIIVTVVAHSQGGLMINYALLKAQHDQPDFPKVLYVGQIITMGTAHTGSDDACGIAAQGVFQAAQQCNDPFVTSARSFLPWLDEYGRDPQGTTRFDTEWTLMASLHDQWVPHQSGRGLPFVSCPTRGCDWYRTPTHWVRQDDANTTLTRVNHTNYKIDTSDRTDRIALWLSRGDGSESYRDGMGHCIRWADSALSTTQW